MPGTALVPAGVEADAVAQLFWIMALGAVVVWLAVVGLANETNRLANGLRIEVDRQFIPS